MKTASLFLIAAVLATGAMAQDAPAPIRFKAATFNPRLGQAPPIPADLTVPGYAHGQRGYYIVQFQGPVRDEWKRQVEAAGAELLHYLPEYAFKVRMTPAQAEAVRALSSVAWVGFFHPAYKLSPALARTGTRLYRVVIEDGADVDAAAVGIVSAGPRLVSQDGNLLRVLANRGQLNAVAHVLDVAWIENFRFPRKHNEYAAGVVMRANQAYAAGYDGSTQTVGVTDTGIGAGSRSAAHADIPLARFPALYNYPGADSFFCYDVIDDGAVDVDTGHGTHTSTSLLGDGGISGEGKGAAPAASLVFQAVENWTDFYGLCEGVYLDGYYLIGIPADIRQLYQQSYTAGARVHSNSWGSDSLGDYTADDANADDFMWSHRDMLLVYSAGNSGTDSGDGDVDPDSIGSPGVAKNVLTVGASEGDRQGHYECDTSLNYGGICVAQGGQNSIFTYGEAWPFDFAVNPLRNDPSAGNGEQMAAFSSRGPTDDGRIKPDVVAPGTWVLSGYSDLYQESYDGSPNPRNGLYQYDGWGFPRSQYYKYMGGTSMSAPLAAGAAALLRDYYQKAHSVSPSAALVKATLISSAHDQLDEDNDGANDNDFPIPNRHEGWGRVDVGNATDGSAQFVDNTTGLSTGGSVSYQYSVANSGSPFKVTLVWTDFPSDEVALKQMVNDLDLVVTSPSGAVYRGNVFSGGWSQTGGAADNRNNIENVFVQSAEAGTWNVQVNATNVPSGPQPFALVVDGSFGAPPLPNQPPVASFTFSCTDLACSFDGSASTDDNGIVSYSWDFGDGAAGSGVTASHTYAAAGAYTVTLTVTDGDGASDTDSKPVTVTAPPPPNQPPVASFTFACTNLACSFDGSGSTDDKGIAGYSWNFGDGATASGVTASHTYAATGAYTVTLTVTDTDGASDSDAQAVTVTAPPPPITLSAAARKVRGKKYVDLAWSGATSANVDVYRNGVIIVVTPNDGAHTDTVKSGGTYTYRVCEQGTANCSNQASVTF